MNSKGIQKCVLCLEVVPFSEGFLSEVYCTILRKPIKDAIFLKLYFCSTLSPLSFSVVPMIEKFHCI